MVIGEIGGGFFVVLAVGFSWWLLAWVSSKVVALSVWVLVVGMVVGTVIMVVVAS